MTAMADLCRVVGDERTVDNLKQEQLGKNALKEKKLVETKFSDKSFLLGKPTTCFACVCVCGSLGACSVPSSRDD